VYEIVVTARAMKDLEQINFQDKQIIDLRKEIYK